MGSGCDFKRATGRISEVMHMPCILVINVYILAVIFFLLFSKMFPLKETGQKVHRISLLSYYFLQLNANLQLSQNFKK